jgi:methyltransferase-like protein
MGGDRIERSYDEGPYPGSSYASTHPDRMATLATLLGLEPAPVERCRVLELGCASGANLLPMADELRESEFVGVDLSEVQIGQGRGTVEALGLTNVRLEHLDLMDLGEEFGRFDYIIAHGLYSWVPEPVRERLLKICRANLAPQGVAYVSYNTYPGWLMLRGARDVMLYHTADIEDPLERSDEARRLVQFLGRASVPESGPFGAFLVGYGERLDEQWSLEDQDGGALLRHDELAEVNDPFWFHEFAAAAERHGLQYLVETDLASVSPGRLDPKDVEILRATAENLVQLEQYLDLLYHRTFRQTLITHEEVDVQRGLAPDPARLAAFHVASHGKPEETDLDVRSVTSARFKASDTAVLTTDHPVSKAAMSILAERYPLTLPFDDLLAEAGARVYDTEAERATRRERDAGVLAENLLRGYSTSTRLIELRVRPPGFVTTIGSRPTAAALPRHAVATGGRLVTNLRHERVGLDPLSAHVLPLLDGANDRVALLAHLEELAADGALAIEHDGQRVEGETALRAALAEQLDASLDSLARSALLVG